MTAEYWHARAAEALARADQMRDPEAIRTMRVLAELYERTAQRLAWTATRSGTLRSPDSSLRWKSQSSRLLVRCRYGPTQR